MKITIRELRRIIREGLGGKTTKTMFSYLGNPLSPDINDREQLGSLAIDDIDTIEDDDGLPLHLREPVINAEESWGPVPPTDDNPYFASSDPLTRDTSPLPSKGFPRG